MTIELYFSNRLEALADKFAEIMSAATAEADVLEAPAVVVPNANLAKWLKLFLAQDTGICMNVGFRYLEDGLWEMLSALDEDEVPPERMNEERLVLLLLHILEHLEIDDPDMAPVARYLMDDGGSRRPDYPARLWQFSHRLAGLFQEYEYHRTDMVQRWLEPAAASPRPMERCQQKLYLRMKRLSEDASKRSGRRLLSLWQYADEVLSGSAPDALSPDRRCGCVHFFGLSQISVFHLRLLGRLQPCWDMHIYAFNPSREFWEDVQTPRERRWIRRSRAGSLVIQEAERESGELAGAEDNALLAAWGKPGRESVRLLCELTDYNFNSCFAVPDAEAGVLQRVQSDILSRSSAAGDGHRRLRQDRSLQIAACPSRSREVETVHDSILVNLEQDESLQLTDIAVLVPDISAYKPLFDTVFQRKPARISYNLVDSHAEIESVYGNAVLSLLTLCAGRFTRNEVFALLLNPCLMSRWNIEPEAVHAWAEWTEALNIFHCFDRASKRTRGYPDSDAYTWKLGLQRLRLSRIMAAPQVVDPRGFVHYRGRVPYGDLRTGETGLLETFCMVIETLHGAVERLRQPGAGGRQWCRRFLEVCDRLLEVPDDRRGESAVRQALVRAFQGLEFYDDLYASGSQPFMDVEWVREFVHAHLRAISGGHGDYLTGGVTVSALRPMRPIPFRLVYVLGMEEGSFPGRAETSSLDLRLARRRIGDISLPERNAYLFLEALLSVRDRLYLSYVSRDLQKDRKRQPCILLHQLMRVVEEEILPPGQRFRVAEVPLAGSSDRYCDPGAVNEWSDVLVNRSLADRVAWLRIRGRWEAFRRRASAQDLERVGRFTPELAPPAGSRAGAAAAQTEEKITLRQLKRFLVNPVREK
ncbi:MAG: exodeoxyribonuclease V subunit gamma, partial [Desulfobacteraceae bacterium]|nr:exodeoxyribonuclease V subunit gamma [Desulfobacteraceae bacterium]